jgi:hypothetical protein
MCPSMIGKLKVIVYFRKVFLLSKFKYFCFVTILDMSLISRSCKNDHIIFNVGIPRLEARNIRLVNIITCIIEESKLSSRYVFSWYPFYFDFHSARIIFDMSSGFYLWNINNTKADICKK